VGEEGIDDAFELVHEIADQVWPAPLPKRRTGFAADCTHAVCAEEGKSAAATLPAVTPLPFPCQVRTCVWVAECLVYTTKAGRLNYTVGGEVITLQHLDRPLYIVGYLPKENRIYLLDRDFAIVSYQVGMQRCRSCERTPHTHKLCNRLPPQLTPPPSTHPHAKAACIRLSAAGAPALSTEARPPPPTALHLRSYSLQCSSASTHQPTVPSASSDPIPVPLPCSAQLLLAVLEYQTAVVRRDFATAANLLPAIPQTEHNRIARFLEAQARETNCTAARAHVWGAGYPRPARSSPLLHSGSGSGLQLPHAFPALAHPDTSFCVSQGFKEEALAVATDPEHQFELAVQLGKLETAYAITQKQPSEASA
jgi:hypothetical protein